MSAVSSNPIAKNLVSTKNLLLLCYEINLFVPLLSYYRSCITLPFLRFPSQPRCEYSYLIYCRVSGMWNANKAFVNIFIVVFLSREVCTRDGNGESSAGSDVSVAL